ncbi:MAG: L,D-transpeptidase/peptidoglycan binding protein [Lachnospiraceae bacterium]|nr:L,D-transpeptidase/peptidoglycan binding protein [Lachnospiraceae bacterium]
MNKLGSWKEWTKKRKYIVFLGIGVPILCVAAIYFKGLSFYKNHFVNGTTINQVDVSGLTVEELKGRIQEYILRVEERCADGTMLEEEILGTEIGLSYLSTEPFEEILRNQNHYLWFLKQDRVLEAEKLITYEEEALEAKLDSLKGFGKDFAVKPENAYIASVEEGNGFVIVEETQGNLLNRAKTLDVIRAAVEELEERVNLVEEGCYETAEITSENERLQAAFEKLDRMTNIQITYRFGEEEEILDGREVAGWVKVDGLRVVLDEDKISGYVASLRKKYDTIFKKRTFQTSYGAEITISKGDYGWWMDTGQEVKELSEMIERGESDERIPVYHQTAAVYGMPDYGDTYVEINLTAQHLFLYIDGEMLLETDFVSGNASRGYDTPDGIYGITYKQRDATLVGETYRTPVNFWMPFNNNVGMHDAAWRDSFGGDIYKTGGSHGCINLPYSAAKEIYGYIEKGTPVICYHLPGTEPVVEEIPQEGAMPGEVPPEGMPVGGAVPGGVLPEGVSPESAVPVEGMVQ